MTSQFDNYLKNIARGQATYREQRLRIAALIAEHLPAKPTRLSPFLAKRLLKLNATNWIALAFSDKDWRHFDRLLSASSLDQLPAYISLACSCIETNAEEISEVYAFDLRFSKFILNGELSEAGLAIGKMPGQSHQSLYALRLMAALNARSGAELIELFNKQPISNWLKQRFIYPFVYYFLNVPADQFMDFHMSVAMPPGHENSSEKALIRYLLRDEVAFDVPLAAKIYAGLLCHPYDICEMMVNHLEGRLAGGETLTEAERQLSTVIVSTIPEWRVPPALRETPLRLILAEGGTASEMSNPMELSDEHQSMITACLAMGGGLSAKGDKTASALHALFRMCAVPYPEVTDYEAATGLARRYHGTMAGRLLTAILTSLYLLPRRDQKFEILTLCRMATYIGAVNPFVAASPRARTALVGGLAGLPRLSAGDLDKLSDVLAIAAVPRDRSWIKRVHWTLSRLASDGRFKEWLDNVLRAIPIAPAYLTGIDWEWFRFTLKATGLRRFLGDTSAAYSLLLEQIEEKPRDANALRLVLQPVAEQFASLPKFVEWLTATYGINAVAFLRFFLTADNVLWLGLASNYVAALTQRADMISWVATKFGLNNDIMPEEAWIQEQRAVTTSLIMMNVSVNQFDIAWDIISRDAATRNAGIFEAYLTVSSSVDEGSLLAHTKQDFPHQFPSGRVVQYSIVADEFPLTNVILSIINTFMEHPSQGIEAILSIRIRHNNLRREIINALHSVRTAFVRGPSLSDRSYVVPQFEEVVGAAVQAWLDDFMHQRRPDRPKGVFDFAPSQKDLRYILYELADARAFPDISSRVVDWLKQTLRVQVGNARELVLHDLRELIFKAIDCRADALQLEIANFNRTTEIAELIKAAIGLRVDELSEWFKCPESSTQLTVSYAELASVIEDRFQSEVISKNIRFDPVVQSADMGVMNDQVRLLFNIWTDLVANVIQHGNVAQPRLRVSQVCERSWRGLRFSSTVSIGEPFEKKVVGHPYVSPSDALFREGNSGLRKVASLAASIAGEEVEVFVVRRKAWFHVFVPLHDDNQRALQWT